MATCLFVASGLEFDVNEYLHGSPFKPRAIFYKGDVPLLNNPKRQPRPDSGFVVIVGDDQERSATSQLQTAFNFLIQHEPELQSVKRVGVDNMLLDFTVVRGHEVDKSEYFPPELIQRLAGLGMGLVTSTVLPRSL